MDLLIIGVTELEKIENELIEKMTFKNSESEYKDLLKFYLEFSK